MYTNTITITITKFRWDVTEMVRLRLCHPSTVTSTNTKVVIIKLFWWYLRTRALRGIRPFGKTTSNANVFPVKHNTSVLMAKTVVTVVFVNNFVNKPPPPLRPWQQTLKYLQPLLRRTIKYLQPLLRLKFKVLALADTAMKLMEKDMELLSKLIASKRSSKLIALKQQWKPFCSTGGGGAP